MRLPALPSRAAGDKNQYELLKLGIFLRRTLQSLRLVYAGEKDIYGSDPGYGTGRISVNSSSGSL